MNPNLEEKKFSAEHRMADLIENALLHGIFGGRTANRREFFKLVGGATALAIIEEVLPLSAMKAWAAETGGKLEKTDLKVGFIPITCGDAADHGRAAGFTRKRG